MHLRNLSQLARRRRTRRLNQVVEHTARVLKQRVRTAHLDDAPVRHHDHAVRVHHGVQTVCDLDHRGAREQLPHRALDHLVRLVVNVRRGLVHQQDARAAQQCTGDADELLLAHAEVAAAVLDEGTDAPDLLHVLEQLHGPEGVGDLRILVLVERVDVRAHGAGEEHGVLRDDAHATAAETVEAELRNVAAVDFNAAALDLSQTEQRHDETGLAGPSAPYDTDTLPGLDREAGPVEHKRQRWAVSHSHVLELDAAEAGPRRRDALGTGVLPRRRRHGDGVGLLGAWGLGGQRVHVLHKAFHAHELGLALNTLCDDVGDRTRQVHAPYDGHGSRAGGKRVPEQPCHKHDRGCHKHTNGLGAHSKPTLAHGHAEQRT
eukprot:PhM_4_TR14158/c0_g1_i1/m.51486